MIAEMASCGASTMRAGAGFGRPAAGAAAAAATGAGLAVPHEGRIWADRSEALLELGLVLKDLRSILNDVLDLVGGTVGAECDIVRHQNLSFRQCRMLASFDGSGVRHAEQFRDINGQ